MNHLVTICCPECGEPACDTPPTGWTVPGVVHGDANVGNVLVDDEGRAALIDLDGFPLARVSGISFRLHCSTIGSAGTRATSTQSSWTSTDTI